MSACRASTSDVVPLVVKPKVAWKMLGCGNTRGYELLAAGELDSFLDGRSRKITVESIRRYIARRLLAGGTSLSTPAHARGHAHPGKRIGPRTGVGGEDTA